MAVGAFMNVYSLMCLLGQASGARTAGSSTSSGSGSSSSSRQGGADVEACGKSLLTYQLYSHDVQLFLC